MYKYGQHLKMRGDQQFRLESILEKNAPSVESAARELLSGISEAAVPGQNETEDFTYPSYPPCHLNPKSLCKFTRKTKDKCRYLSYNKGLAGNGLNKNV